jgi:hypothetical protein
LDLFLRIGSKVFDYFNLNSFEIRVKILESFGDKDIGFPSDSAYRIRIRRNFLYEDAFDNLSLENGFFLLFYFFI